MDNKFIIARNSTLRALFAGLKTQFRQVIYPKPQLPPCATLQLFRHGSMPNRWLFGPADGQVSGIAFDAAPKYQVGDKIYVKEATYTDAYLDVYYAVDDTPANGQDRDWEPDLPDSIPAYKMPEFAARVWLDITNIRAELLHNISRGDAQAEGIPQTYGEAVSIYPELLADVDGYVWDNRTTQENFKWVWNKLTGRWRDNPVVWVYEFTVSVVDD